MRKYVVIEKTGINNLEDSVNKLIADGYMPQGGVVIMPGYKTLTFLQSMYMPKELAKVKRCSLPYTSTDVVEHWNKAMSGTNAKQKRVVTDNLKASILARGKSDFKEIGEWLEYFEFIKQSRFLMGETSDFGVSLDWVVKPTNMSKIIEGNYHG